MKYPAQKILVIATRQFGDVLLTTPLLRSLRCAYPQAVIDVLVFEGKESILEGNPDINQRITIPEHPRWIETLKLARKICRQYDLSISTLSGDKPLFYALCSGKKRVSVVPPQEQDFWKRTISAAWTELDDKNTHTITQYLRLAELLDIPLHYQVINPTSSTAAEKLDRKLPFDWRKQPFAVLHLTPMWRYKYWTLNGWSELAHYLINSGISVVLIGGGKKRDMGYSYSALFKMPKSVVSLVGKLRFSEVTTLIESSRLYVGLDTAVTHLAAATGVPTVAIYGPTNPVKWAPWPVNYTSNTPPFQRRGVKGFQRVGNVFLIQSEEYCVPCHQEGCERHRKSRSRCLFELESVGVINVVQKVLSE